MKFTAKVLTCGRSTPAGHIYEYDEICRAIEEYKKSDSTFERGYLGFLFFSEKTSITINDKLSLENTTGVINDIYFKGMTLFVDVTLLDTPNGQFIKPYLNTHPEALMVTILGEGYIDEDGSVQDYSLNGFVLTKNNTLETSITVVELF